MANEICFKLFCALTFMAFCLAFAKTGKSIAARIPIIAITTSNSMRVKADLAGPCAKIGRFEDAIGGDADPRSAVQ